MKRLVLLATVGLAALAFPSAAPAAPPVKSTVNASVAGGVLTSTSPAAVVNTVTLAWSFGGATVTDSTGAGATPVGTGCSFLSETSAYCFAASASIQTLDLADSIVNKSTLPATLDGGAGNDTITAGEGDDQIDARDGLVDTVDCGAGNDTVQADPGDVLSNCEVGAPSGETGTGTVSVGPTTAPVRPGTPIDAERLLTPPTVVGQVIAQVTENAAVSVTAKGTAPFTIACAAGAPSACTGAIYIDPAPAARARRKKARPSSVSAFMARRGRYGSSPFKVQPGAEGSTQVKLTGVAMRAIGKPRGRKARSARRGRRVRAIVTIAPKNTRAQRVRITLKG